MLGVSRPTSILSSKNTSDIIRLVSGMSTQRSFVLAKGMSLSRIATGGYMDARGEVTFKGSQLRHLSIAFTRFRYDGEQ